jgi:type IX secretion system PorP/SprF family membrane protein
MKKRISLAALLGIICGLPAVAQDIHFAQYAETPSIINPALAGVTYNTRIIVNFRDQWSAVAAPYRTMGFSYEQTIKHKKLKNNYFAIAANVFRDEAGDARLRTLNPNLGLSYIQRVTKSLKLSGGMQSGFIYKTIDMSNLRWDEQFNGYNYDASLPSGEPASPRSAITSFDIGGGMNLNYIQSERFITAKDAAKFDVGISAYHFSIPRSSFIISSEKLQPRICGYFNGDFSIPNSINSLMPSILYMRQGGNSEVIAGALFKFIIGDPSTYTPNKRPRAVSIGGYYRLRDAIIPTFLFQYNKVAFGMSYDINVSALTPASNRRGGIEFMFRYNVWPGYGVNLGRRDAKPSY